MPELVIDIKSLFLMNDIFFSFEVLGKDIEFGKPALYIETSSEDLVLVSNVILFYFSESIL